MSDTPSSGALWTLGIVGAFAMASEMRQADARAGVNQGSRARAPKIPDLSLDVVKDGQRVKLGGQYVVQNPRDPAHPLRFDARYEGRGGEGLGAVSDNANVDTLGFAVWMTPTEFLRLSPALRMDDIGTAKGRATDIAALVAAGASLGPPFLVLEDGKAGASRSPPVYRVRSHEGRHRVHAIRMLAGEVAFPVHVFGSFRARAVDYPPRRLAGAVLLPDPRVAGNEPVSIGTFCSRGTVHAPTGSRNDGVPARLRAVETWARTQGVELRLAPYAGLHHGGSVIEITDLFADRAGSGAGTRVMERLVAAADVEGTNLILHPSSPRNVAFYGRFGFKRSPRAYGMMFRYAERSEDE